MYVYYEIFSSGTNNPQEDVYEFVLSSDGRNSQIAFYDKYEKARHAFITNLFKQIPLEVRQYDAQSYVTTLIGTAGKRMVLVIKTMIAGGFPGGVTLDKITDLQTKLQKSQLNYVEPPPKKSREAQEVEIKFKEEDFFHKPEAPKGELFGEALWRALAEMLDISLSDLQNTPPSDLKRFYRAKALQLHPDRPGGNADKMSQLNKLWALYTA